MSKRWSELPEGRRAGLVALAAVEVVLTVTAAVDLFRRPQEELRGYKALWWPILVIQPFGPIAYLALAKKPRGQDQ